MSDTTPTPDKKPEGYKSAGQPTGSHQTEDQSATTPKRTWFERMYERIFKKQPKLPQGIELSIIHPESKPETLPDYKKLGQPKGTNLLDDEYKKIRAKQLTEPPTRTYVPIQPRTQPPIQEKDQSISKEELNVPIDKSIPKTEDESKFRNLVSQKSSSQGLPTQR